MTETAPDALAAGAPAKARVDGTLKPALFVFCFAPIGHPEASSPMDHLTKMWSACDEPPFNMTSANAQLGVGTVFRPGLGIIKGFEMLAAKRNPKTGGLFSALQFLHHDVAGVVVCLAPNDPNKGIDDWPTLYADWCKAMVAAGAAPPEAPASALGEVLVFQALCEEGPGIAERFAPEVRRHLPPGAIRATTGHWADAFCVTDEGFALWEAADPLSDEAVRRVICALVPEPAEERFDVWAWAAGRQGLRPFQRYLLHASKLRFESRVYGSMRPVSEIREEVESEVESLLSLHEIISAGTPVPARTLLEAQQRLIMIETSSSGLLDRSTRLREVRRTVQIAGANFSRPSVSPAIEQTGRGVTLFDRDRKLAQWLRDSIDNDLDYFGAIHERAKRAEELTTQRVAQAAETQHERLALLQTSVLGALLMALGYIQATQIRVPLAAPLRWPLLALLSGLALGLPAGVFLWFGALRARGPYRVFDFFAVGLLGAAFAYFFVELGWWAASSHGAPAAITGPMAVLGFAAFVGFTAVLDRGRRAARPSPE
jgi:hypothetical protein